MCVCVCVRASYTHARTRIHTQCYMGVVVHFIQSEKSGGDVRLTMSRAAVALRAQRTHTIEDWQRCLRDVACQFDTQFETVTTDGASEFTSPKFLSPEHEVHVRTRLPCFAHAWELGVGVALEHAEYRDAWEDFAWITGNARTPEQRMALLNETAKRGESLRSAMQSRCAPVRAL